LEEEEDEGPPPVEPESGPSLFSPLAEDARVEGAPAWTPRCSSALAPERAVAVLRCSVWPGAVAYATTGKSVFRVLHTTDLPTYCLLPVGYVPR
jgi:hypothetical protein